MRTIRQFKKQAKESFNKHQKTSVVVAAIYIYSIVLVNYSANNLIILFRRHTDIINILSSVVIFVLVAAFSVGLSMYTLEIINSDKSDINTFFSSFEYIFNVFMLKLLKTVFILLWSLLLVVPGIIAAYRYRMAEYIMAENPNISPLKAISLSKQMMKNKKLKLFDLDCTFIGWLILSIATLGITGLYALPYAHLAVANFFIDVRDEYMEELNFRAEWNARKSTDNQNTSKHDYTDKSEERKQKEWENYTWEHKDNTFH